MKCPNCNVELIPTGKWGIANRGVCLKCHKTYYWVEEKQGNAVEYDEREAEGSGYIPSFHPFPYDY